jgi:hypothetical protein
MVQYLPQKREKLKYQKIALQQLRIPINAHARLFTYIFKASSLAITNTQLSSLKELFNDTFYENIKSFNFIKQAPVNSKKIWAQYITQECLKFSVSLEKVTYKYSYYLDSNLIVLLEKLRHSHFISFFLEEAEVRIFTKDNCWVHIDNILDLYKEHNYSIFVTEGNENILEEHIECFLSLVRVYNEICFDNQIKVDNRLWKDNIAPKVGSAREN